MRLPTLPGLWMIALLFGSACAPQPPEFNLPDVEYHDVRLVGELSMDPEPLFVLGTEGDDGHPDLHIVWGGGFLGDELVLANEGSRSFLVFDEEGRLLREIGEAGEGPGEFRRVHGVEALGEGRGVVWDRALERVTVITTMGEVHEVVELDRRGSLPMREVRAIGTNHFAAFHHMPPRRFPRGHSRQEVRVGLWTSDGNEVAEIGPVPGREVYGAGAANVPVPLGHAFFTAGTDRGLFVASGKEGDLLEYDPTGQPVRRLLLPIERKEVSAVQREELLALYEEQWSVSNEWIAALETAFRADSFPAFDRLESGGRHLWVRLAGGSGPTREWLKVDPGALEAHSVMLPSGAEVLDAMADRVALLMEDESGREEVRVYRLGGAE
jgi:hypothetical protein